MSVIEIAIPRRNRLTNADVKIALEGHAPSADARRIYVSDIIAAVVRHFKTPKKHILSEKRARELVYPRQLAMYLAKKLTTRSLPEIGRAFDGRDHTTVLHSIRKIEDLLNGNDERVLDDILAILDLLDGGGADFGEPEEEAARLGAKPPEQGGSTKQPSAAPFTPRISKPSFNDVRRITCELLGISGLEEESREEVEIARCICCLVVKNYSEAQEMHAAGRAIGDGYIGVLRYTRIAERQLETNPVIAVNFGKLLHRLGIAPYEQQ